MAEKKRQKQVAEIIKRHFSTVLLDRGSYIYGDVLVSVTNVIMSPDLRVAKIYLSIYNSENKDYVMDQIEEYINTLKHDLVSMIRNQVRVIPDIRVFKDDLLDEMYRINDMLDNLD